MTDSSEKTIRIFILDPYALIRAGLRLIIESEPDMKVVGEAGDSTTGIEMVARQKPDITLLKLNALGDPYLDVIPQLLEAWNQTRIILMTTTDDFQTCSQAVQMGVIGVVSKTQPPKALIKAIKKVYDGEVWIERSMMAHLLKTMSPNRRPSVIDPETEKISQLSNREKEVIHLIGLGLRNKFIANQLSIGETTVRHHLTSIYDKLGVSDRLELLVFAHRSGLIKPDGKRPK
jgi:two-component system, NarL family, nitrate/nitrite response regulator NarL